MPNRIRNLKLEIRRKLTQFFFGICFLFFGISSNAQCAMCRAALESEADTARGEAVNDGIVYLMAIPYILVAVIGFVVYRMFAKKKTNNI
ncbi:MAG: hypothetical protein JNJ52_02505 [Flavobacterium sp.]|nr:hypothetical protein [Flavobacterium sp.]